MAEFTSWRSYSDFACSIKKEWRYVRSPEQNAYIDAVLSSSASRVTSIPRGAQLWRAQQHHEWAIDIHGDQEVDILAPAKAERMKPLRDQAVEGRANPKGIPYLYASTHKETAIAEVRPWIGSLVTVAVLAVLHPLKIVNCTSHAAGSPLLFFEEPNAADREAANWKDIDEAFSRPVTACEHAADYAPTQVLAEAFQQQGFDGIAYRSSSANDGHNIAIFNLDSAEVRQCRLCVVKSLQIVAEDENPNLIWNKKISR